MDLYCLRERDLLKQFTEEVSLHLAQGKSREKALMLSYQLAEDLARAFTERTILQIFLADEMNVPSGSLKVYSHFCLVYNCIILLATIVK